jgi:hypothetical protein
MRAFIAIATFIAIAALPLAACQPQYKKPLEQQLESPSQRQTSMGRDAEHSCLKNKAHKKTKYAEKMTFEM